MNDSMNQLPLQMPSIGGGQLRRQRLRQALWALGGAVLVCGLLLMGRPRVAPRPIANLHKNGVHGVYNLRSKKNELLIYNFRAIEPGKLFRASGFPRNHRGEMGGKMGIYPAAYFDREAYEFLKAHNIRTVISLNPEKEFFAEKGYFKANNAASYEIQIIHWPVSANLVYSRDRGQKDSALGAAIRLINFMKQSASPAASPKGAVLVYGEAGKDAVGVVAAAYELWRNTGHGKSEELWQQIRARYAVSDVLIRRDKDARKVALSGKMLRCKDGSMAFVCPENLDALRPELELIAQMD